MVIFTDSLREELTEIARHSVGAARRFYIYSKEAAPDVDYLRLMLPDFRFVPLQQTRQATYADLFAGNSADDFFVLKQPRLSNIMDRDIEMYQIVLKGRKIVVDNHPFLGKSEVFWCYFPYSFFDKSLLGYPHSYAFRDAKSEAGLPDPFDVQMLGQRVASATTSYKSTVFGDKPQTISVALTAAEHEGYAALKERLFDGEQHSPRQIVRELKKYVDQTASIRAATSCQRLNLLDLNQVWKQWKQGARLRVVSDAKVDIYLASELDAYLSRCDEFMSTVYEWKGSGGG